MIDLDRLESAVDRAIQNQACVAVAPGEMREAIRLARIGSDWEVTCSQRVRPVFVDDGA